MVSSGYLGRTHFSNVVIPAKFKSDIYNACKATIQQRIDAANVAVQAAREASNLTNQLLSFERASGQDIAHSNEILDLKALVSRVVDTFQLQHLNKNVEVSIEVPKAFVRIRGDAIMLQEAILNLLTNAAVHGGPEMSKIKLSLSHEENKAVLSIRDDGIGIPTEKHIEAISRFGQANGGPGSGLGLPIAMRVIQNHGGSLEILASLNGAWVVVTLPLSATT